jgi:hypothetical protein
MMGYGVTAYACFPGDQPVKPSFIARLRDALVFFDLVALAGALAGGAVSLWLLRHLRHEAEGGIRHGLHSGAGRARFLALWGMLSSLWFFFAILFNTIASVTVPPCLN